MFRFFYFYFFLLFFHTIKVNGDQVCPTGLRPKPDEDDCESHEYFYACEIVFSSRLRFLGRQRLESVKKKIHAQKYSNLIHSLPISVI